MSPTFVIRLVSLRGPSSSHNFTNFIKFHAMPMIKVLPLAIANWPQPIEQPPSFHIILTASVSPCVFFTFGQRLIILSRSPLPLFQFGFLQIFSSRVYHSCGPFPTSETAELEMHHLRYASLLHPAQKLPTLKPPDQTDLHVKNFSVLISAN